MQQRYVVLMLVLVAAMFMYMAYLIKTSDANVLSLEPPAVGMSQQPRMKVRKQFVGEKRYPVVKKAQSPNRVPFKTGVYLVIQYLF